MRLLYFNSACVLPFLQLQTVLFMACLTSLDPAGSTYNSWKLHDASAVVVVHGVIASLVDLADSGLTAK